MKRTLKSIVMAPLFASLCLLTSISTMAQSEQASESIKEANGIESNNCPAAQQFSSGNGANKFAFCISEHGNIQNLEFPATFKHIGSKEGYVVCSNSNNVVHGFDAGFMESGWGPATATQPNGPHTLPLSIIRDSIDGKVQFKQTFNWDTTRKDILVTMVVKNISAASLSNVYLSRYFDGDIDNSPGDIYDTDGDSVWAYDNNASHGLRFTPLSFALKRFQYAENYNNWSPNIAGPQTARQCFVGGSEGTPTAPGDYVGRINYVLGTLNPGQSKTAIVLYGRL